MSLEQMGDYISTTTVVEDMQQINDSDVEKRVGLGNLMQVQLADAHQEDFEVFLDEHGEDFRSLVEDNPKLLEEFEKDPEQTLNKISEIIYH
jgi:hypothetical protein